MGKITDVIDVLRNGKPLYGDYVRNRYCVTAAESNGGRTVYCFSAPIYRAGTNMLIEPVFHNDGGMIHMEGSDAAIYISSNISLRNKHGEVKILTADSYEYISEKEVLSEGMNIYPSLNGITCKKKCNISERVRFKIAVQAPDIQIRVNNKCFAFMRAQFIPLMTVSCIGSLDGNGMVVAPALLDYVQTGNMEYEITISTSGPYAESVLYEMNMYEPKLFQDTTVESNDPQSNNAFGGTAFIGNTRAYGEQWLYIRPELSGISDIASENVSKVMLHLPAYHTNPTALKAYSVSHRFCSFGSNWNNKISSKYISTYALTDRKGYISFDITDMYSDRTSGYIIKPACRDSGFACVATGDNYNNPVVLELHIR